MGAAHLRYSTDTTNDCLPRFLHHRPWRSGYRRICNEVSNTGNYARVAITFGAAASREISSSADVQFATLNGTLGTATHWVVTDSGTYGAGNVLGYGGFAVPKVLNSGNTPTVVSGSVKIQVPTLTTTTWSDYLVHSMLDFTFRNTAFSQPATYVSVTTVIVTVTMTGSTITQATGISRVLVNKAGGASPAWSVPSSGAGNNANDITITGFDATQTLTSIAICDAASAGNLLLLDNTMTDQAVGVGDTYRFTATNLAYTVA